MSGRYVQDILRPGMSEHLPRGLWLELPVTKGPLLPQQRSSIAVQEGLAPNKVGGQGLSLALVSMLWSLKNLQPRQDGKTKSLQDDFIVVLIYVLFSQIQDPQKNECYCFLLFPPKVTKPGTLLLGSTISDNLRFQNEICALTRVPPQIQFEVKTLGVSRDANCCQEISEEKFPQMEQSLGVCRDTMRAGNVPMEMPCGTPLEVKN